MNKDIQKYIANCTLCHREKAKIQLYSLQMMEIPDRPFDKIAIDLITVCKTSTLGNKHILTIIYHLTGWPEAFPIPDKTTDTIDNEYLPVLTSTCAHNTSYWTMEQNSKTVSWTKFCNNYELTEYFQHHITHRVMAS